MAGVADLREIRRLAHAWGEAETACRAEASTYLDWVFDGEGEGPGPLTLSSVARATIRRLDTERIEAREAYFGALEHDYELEPADAVMYTFKDGPLAGGLMGRAPMDVGEEIELRAMQPQPDGGFRIVVYRLVRHGSSELEFVGFRLDG